MSGRDDRQDAVSVSLIVEGRGECKSKVMLSRTRSSRVIW